MVRVTIWQIGPVHATVGRCLVDKQGGEGMIAAVSEQFPAPKQAVWKFPIKISQLPEITIF
jgi:hypothetical protein